VGAAGPSRLRRLAAARRARPGDAAVPGLGGAAGPGGPVLGAGQTRRRDLPRRPGAGPDPRSGHRPQRAGRPPDDLPAQVPGAPGLSGHRLAARPLLPDLSRLRRGRDQSGPGRQAQPVSTPGVALLHYPGRHEYALPKRSSVCTSLPTTSDCAQCRPRG
jgi:hypothetical protein